MKVRDPSLPYYLPIAEGIIVIFIPFPKDINAMINANSLVQGLNSVSILYDDDYYTLRASNTIGQYDSVIFLKTLKKAEVAPKEKKNQYNHSFLNSFEAEAFLYSFFGFTSHWFILQVLVWCSSYHWRKWAWQSEFKSCTRLLCAKGGIKLSLLPQLWLNSRADWVL